MDFVLSLFTEPRRTRATFTATCTQTLSHKRTRYDETMNSPLLYT